MNSYIIEHQNGGSWWTQMGWKPHKGFALTFRDLEGVQNFIKTNIALAGSNIVTVESDSGPARPDAVSDYNPFGYGRRGKAE